MPTKQQLQTELKVLKEDRANLEREIREAWACARKFEDAYRKAIESPSAPSELRGPAAQGPTLDAKWLMHTANYWRARGNQEGAAKWREGLEMIHARAVGVLFHQPAVKGREWTLCGWLNFGNTTVEGGPSLKPGEKILVREVVEPPAVVEAASPAREPLPSTLGELLGIPDGDYTLKLRDGVLDDIQTLGAAGSPAGAPKAELGVGDWVRILPVVKEIPGDSTIRVVEDMVCMVGALYRVEAVDGALATVNGWAFRLEWLQRYVPDPSPSARGAARLEEGTAGEADRQICLRCGELDAKIESLPPCGPDGESDEGCSKCGGTEFAETTEKAIEILVKSNNRIEELYFDAAGKLQDLEIAAKEAAPGTADHPLEVVGQEDGSDGMPVRVLVSNGVCNEWFFSKGHPMAQAAPGTPIEAAREALQAFADGSMWEYVEGFISGPDCPDGHQDARIWLGADDPIKLACDALEAMARASPDGDWEQVHALAAQAADELMRHDARSLVVMIRDIAAQHLPEPSSAPAPDRLITVYDVMEVQGVQPPAPASPAGREVWWYCANCRGCRPATRVNGDLLCACGHVIASYLEAPADPEAGAPGTPCPGIVSKDCTGWTCTYNKEGICLTCGGKRPQTQEGGSQP